MKALLLDRPGGPSTLRLAEVPRPLPAAGEVRVKVHAVGLNPADYKFIERGFPEWRYPFIPGLDVAGTIDALGEKVAGWKIGDTVYYHGNFSKPGGFAEWAIAAAVVLAPLPPGLSFTEAAALPCAGFTAYQVLYHKLRVRRGQSVLIHGGAGGVGGFAVQFAALEGLQVISTASERNRQWVERLGATEVLDYNTEDIPARVREITGGRGVDAIVDTVSSASATVGIDLLAFGGGIACVAGWPNFAGTRSFGKAISVHDVALGGAYLSGDDRALRELADIGKAFGDRVGCRQIDPMLQETIRLEDIPAALTRLSRRHVRGKIVAQF